MNIRKLFLNTALSKKVQKTILLSQFKQKAIVKQK